MKFRSLILAALLLGACALNVMVTVDRAEASRDEIYELRMGHARFGWWLSSAIDDCSVLVFQRPGEEIHQGIARVPDEGGCFILRPGDQTVNRPIEIHTNTLIGSLRGVI